MKPLNLVAAFILAICIAACGGGTEADTRQNTFSASRLQSTPAPQPTSYNSAVQELYLAYFGRAADPTGLAGFSAQMAALNAPSDVQALSSAYSTDPAIQKLIDSFGSSAESQALYGGDTTALVTAIFKNILNRAPLDNGLAFWVNAIDSGRLTRGGASLAILAGALANTSAQGIADSTVITSKVGVATLFTASLDTHDKQTLYTGSDAAASVRAMLGRITSATSVGEFQGLVDSELSELSIKLAPTAAVYAPGNAIAGSPVALDGSLSTDPEGKSLSYTWSLSSRPSTSKAVIFLPNTEYPLFVTDVVGAYVVTLTVSNGIQTNTTSITVAATDQPPTNNWPIGATAICNDGSYSYSTSRSGTCSHHGGVRTWL